MGRRKVSGFTLIEILVVVAIIGLLIGVLVPVVRRAQVSAQEAAVKAQMQNLSSGLEMFHADFGYYPSSLPQTSAGVNLATADHTGATGVIQGFHRLAFALVGRDKLGCPAKRGTGTMATVGADPGPDSLTGWYYSTATPGSFNGTWEDSGANWTSANRTARKAPYINPEGFSVVNDSLVADYVPVICDKFDQRKGEKVSGSYANRSIFLYFAANSNGQRIATASPTPAPVWAAEYYYMADNYNALSTNPTFSGAADTEARQRLFGTAIEDANAAIVNDRMPHNKDGYILMSPGPDLQYLTKDDVVNWQQ